MAVERTLCIVKPDAVEKRKDGAILAKLQESGFTIVGMKRMQLSKQVAEGFYAVHKARGFFAELVEFMTRSPVVIAVLEREDAVASYRAVMGARRTRRKRRPSPRRSASSTGRTSARTPSTAPDSLGERGQIEIAYFFPASEVAPRA